jgi:hypothetical protein
MPKIAVIVIRDPDGPDDVSIFVDGVEVNYQDPGVDVFVIDAGAGHERADWDESRAFDVARAQHRHGDRVAELLDAAYADPPGSEYIDE